MDKIKLYNNTVIEVVIDSSVGVDLEKHEFVMTFFHKDLYKNKALSLKFATNDVNYPITKEAIGEGIRLRMTIPSHMHRRQWAGKWTIYLGVIDIKRDSELTGQLKHWFEYVEPAFDSSIATKLSIFLSRVDGEIVINEEIFFILDTSKLNGNNILA